MIVTCLTLLISFMFVMSSVDIPAKVPPAFFNSDIDIDASTASGTGLSSWERTWQHVA